MSWFDDNRHVCGHLISWMLRFNFFWISNFCNDIHTNYTKLNVQEIRMISQYLSCTNPHRQCFSRLQPAQVPHQWGLRSRVVRAAPCLTGASANPGGAGDRAQGDRPPDRAATCLHHWQKAAWGRAGHRYSG